MSNGWISVEDRLPDDGKDVLVSARYRHTGKRWYAITAWRWPGMWLPRIERRSESITHWQPLPEHPQDDAPVDDEA